MSAEKHDIATTVHDLKWEIEAVLAYHDEDAKAAVATLRADVHHLRIQLAIATKAMGPGFGGEIEGLGNWFPMLEWRTRTMPAVAFRSEAGIACRSFIGVFN